MRSLLTVCAVLLVASVAVAGTGQVPNGTLDSFGLGGMQQMTDAQGANVRGMGSYVYLSGGGVASVVGLGGLVTTQNNAYSFGSVHNGTNSLAYGVSGSLAVTGVAVGLPSGTYFGVNGALAVGGGYGYAK